MEKIKETVRRLTCVQRQLLTVILILFAVMVSSIAPGEADDSGIYYILDLKEAQMMALQNNSQLKTARNGLEIAALTLGELNEQIKWVEEQDDSLKEGLESAKRRKEEIEEEIIALDEREEEIIAELAELLDTDFGDINFGDIDFEGIRPDGLGFDTERIAELLGEINSVFDELIESFGNFSESLPTSEELETILEDLQSLADTFASMDIDRTLEVINELIEWLESPDGSFDYGDLEDIETLIEDTLRFFQDFLAFQEYILEFLQEWDFREDLEGITAALIELRNLIEELFELLEEGDFRGLEGLIENLTDMVAVIGEHIEGLEGLETVPEDINRIMALQRELIEIQLEKAILRTELLQTDVTIETLQFIFDNLDFFVQQLKNGVIAADAALQNSEKAVAAGEAMLLYGVEAIFAGVAIIEKQLPLVEEGYYLLSHLLNNEKEKEKEGYSSMLQIIDLEAQLRDIDRAGDALHNFLIDLIDQLCLLIGIRPGVDIDLILFEPRPVKEVKLNDALKKVISDGYDVSQSRENLYNREDELLALEGLMEASGNDDYKNSITYQIALLRVEQASDELKESEDKAYAEVRKAYRALQEAEREIIRCRSALKESDLQEKALLQSFEGGYVTAAQASAGPLGTYKAEAELYTARFQYHLKLREFELAVEGYPVSGFGGMDSVSGGLAGGSGDLPGFGGTSVPGGGLSNGAMPGFGETGGFGSGSMPGFGETGGQ